MTVTTLHGTPDPNEGNEFEHAATVTPLHPSKGVEVSDQPVIEGELVEEDAPGDEGDVTRDVVLVDQPGGDSVHWVRRLRETKREPIIPTYLQSWTEARDTARWVAGHYVHAAGYHAVRAPLYLLRLAVRSPRGALLLAAATGRWVSDAEGRVLRAAAARDEDTGAYLRLSAQRNTRVASRTLTLVITAAIGVPALMLLPDLLPDDPAGLRSWVMWACGALAVALLGRLGTPADQPVVSRAVVAAHVAKLTADTVEKALSVLGISGITSALAKNAHAIGFTAPITRDGPGWRAELDLPAGVTASDVIERREKLASGLGRPLGCVWPEGKPEVHPGRLVLWVGDKDMSKASQPAWPLRTGKRIDLFEAQPFGTDVRGNWVNVTLMYVAAIVGSIPRMGKTFTLRELLLIAALDPRSDVLAFDLKGTGDLSPLEVVAHRYRAGDDPEDIEYMLACLRELRDEMRRRTKVIRELPPDICPENKVTSALASKKSLGLHPVVVGVDECQVMFEHPEHGAEFEEIVTDLVKRGPATGIVIILATQRPDSKSIPPAISDNAILRFCLKVTGQIANDMVLGTSSYKNGERATQFSFGDKGIGLLKGVGDETKTTKGVYIDAPSAKAIAARARVMRVDEGRLSGYAAGVDVQVDEIEAANTLLPDLLTVFGTADKRWSESLVDALAELRPGVYGEWAALPTGAAKATTLSTALKPFHIATKQVWSTENGKGANRMGVERAAVAAALTERDGKKKRG